MKDGAIPLIEKVRQAGVIDHYILLGEGNMRRWDWEKMSSGYRATHWLCGASCFLGQKVPESEMAKILGDKALGFLTRHKLCQSENGQLTMGTACLLSFREHLFFADMARRRALCSATKRAH